MLSNIDIYKKTFRFSLMRMVWLLLGLVVVTALTVAAFLLTDGQDVLVYSSATGIAFIVGLIIFAVIARYVGYLYQAAQIAMMAEGVSTGSLPDDTYAAGKRAVKGKFATATVYFALTAVIKGISREITRGVNAVAGVIDAGKNGPASTVATIVSSLVAIVLEYMNCCCLGWVFLHKDQSSFKSTCDGAVIYFQNWKTLLKNMGTIIAITLVSLVIIGGAFIALWMVVLGGMPTVMAAFSAIDDFLELDAETSFMAVTIVFGLMLWSIVHGTFLKPYILVSVLRRYIEAGEENPPKVDLYGKVAGISQSFKKALGKAKEEGEVPAGA